MANDFVNQRLAATDKFSPAARPSECAQEGKKPHGLGEILATENQRTRSKVSRRDVVETGRRREEVLRDLDDLVVNLQTEQKLVGERLSRFAQLRTSIASLPDDVSGQRLGEVKQAVREAQMEMVKHHRESLSAEGGTSGLEVASLSLGQLARLGFGLGWPVFVGLLIAAAVVSLTLLAVFGVG